MSGIYGRIIIMSNTLENSFIFANFTPSLNDCHVLVKTYLNKIISPCSSVPLIDGINLHRDLR
jgi:hypothetical protein